MLEVIDKGSGRPGEPPLLFVHGAWHGAWCWDEHFLDYFADNGYRALALSLRGHGNSATDKKLGRLSIADYVDDVRTVAETLPTPPVVIGHSMGGLVVQKYLENQPAAAGVLLAAVPPQGTRAAVVRALKQNPWPNVRAGFTGSTMAALDTPARARQSMFSPATPEALVVEYGKRFQQESRRAIFVDMTFRHLPRPEEVSSPMLVLGAEQDGVFTVDEVQATARAYQTEAEIFPGIGHDMMLEPGWQAVAEHIASWLNSTLTPPRS